MTDRELMQQALEALEANLGNWAAKTKAITALRSRLEQPEQEPVARLTCEELGYVPLSADGKSVYIDGVGLVRLAQPEQEPFSPEAISATQAAWKMGYDAAKAEQPEPEPVALPDQMTPAMLSKVQMHSELGAYAAENLTGAYTLFDEFWRVAISALPPHHNARGKHDQR